MQFRSFVVLLSMSLALPMFASCTTRYQDLLRDRDAQIRELNGRIAQLKAAQEDLERQQMSARSEADVRPAERQPSDASLSALRQELDGADVSYRRGRISIGIQDSVTFDSGSDALKGTAHKILQRVASVLKGQFSEHRIYVEGHTDSDPIVRTKDKYRSNRHLSTERADAVARYLIEQGVPERRIVVVGFGQFDPRATATGDKSRNRRVEIVVGDKL
jgi:chemotaxis protein MotB